MLKNVSPSVMLQHLYWCISSFKKCFSFLQNLSIIGKTMKRNKEILKHDNAVCRLVGRVQAAKSK